MFLKSSIRLLLFPILLQLILVSLAKAQGRYGEELPSGVISTLTSIKGILYNGIDNYLLIDTNLSSTCDNLLLTSTNGLIVHDTISNYLMIPERMGNTRLTAYCIESGDTIIMGYKYFDVANLPEPCLTLNTQPIITPALLSKSTLLACDSIGIYISDDIIGSENWFKIKDFILGYNYGGFHVSHTNNSNKISQKTKEIINRLGPDHEITLRFTVQANGKIMKQLPIYRIKIY